jgi:hypothetical protein
MGVSTPAARIRAFPWERVAEDLETQGWSRIGALLDPVECTGLVALYEEEGRFRSHIQMEPRRFGAGDYKYFRAPLPRLVQQSRAAFFPHLAKIANAWMGALGRTERFPRTLGAFLSECARAGQERPTPLLLRYRSGGYNCLHQDVYGTVAFPLQVVVPLSRPGSDFVGGEFVLVEQRPRAQSIARVIAAAQGEAVLFPNRFRPVRGARGVYAASVRHGLSPLVSGERYALGLIFHDAR